MSALVNPYNNTYTIPITKYCTKHYINLTKLCLNFILTFSLCIDRNSVTYPVNTVKRIRTDCLVLGPSLAYPYLAEGAARICQRRLVADRVLHTSSRTRP